MERLSTIEKIDQARRTAAQEQGLVESAPEFAMRYGMSMQDVLINTGGFKPIFVDNSDYDNLRSK